MIDVTIVMVLGDDDLSDIELPYQGHLNNGGGHYQSRFTGAGALHQRLGGGEES